MIPTAQKYASLKNKMVIFGGKIAIQEICCESKGSSQYAKSHWVYLDLISSLMYLGGTRKHNKGHVTTNKRH